MKFIIRQFLIALTLIAIIHESKSKNEDRKHRIGYIVGMLNKIAKNVNVDCVRNFFNLPQNDKMIVGELETKIFSVAAPLKCSAEDEFLIYIMNRFVPDFSGSGQDCLKWKLKQFEPESKLFKNFELDDENVQECKQFFSADSIERMQKKFEREVGSLSEFTCGAVIGVINYLMLIGKASIIEYGSISKELKDEEMGKLKEYFKEKIFTTVNCIRKRFEDDPKAFLLNDTLNYYFKNSVKPFGTEVTKIEGSIDDKCVEEKLNLSENGDKPVLDVEAAILIASAKSKCIKVNSLEFVDNFLKFAIEDEQKTETYVNCAMIKLKKIDSTSKLARNVINDQNSEERCKYYSTVIYPYSNIIERFKRSVGALKETTCGSLSDAEMDLFTVKTLLIAVEKDEELKKSEAEKVFAVVTEKLHKLADCVLKRL